MKIDKYDDVEVVIKRKNGCWLAKGFHESDDEYEDVTDADYRIDSESIFSIIERYR